ncbi:MAG: hypothetical protein FWH52_00120 [Synergistaceae bacterium]|nr:hypothetical protein [Synergistaceae bacterium]
MRNELIFEELESMEELGNARDFIEGFGVGVGVGTALVLTALAIITFT